jgi:hypothetical protein
MKNFIKYAEKTHSYSIVYYNDYLIADSKPFLIKQKFPLKLPNVEFVNYDILLIFDDYDNIEYKINENELILKSEYINVTLPYIEPNNDVNDYFTEPEILYTLADTKIIEKIAKTFNITSGQVFIRNDKIICEANTVFIEFKIDDTNIDNLEITELFKITDDYKEIRITNESIIGITNDDIEITYFVNT